MLRLPILFATAVALCAALATAPAFAADDEAKKEKSYPSYSGVITGKNVNIRSGPGISFSRLAKANGGYGVIVVGEMNDWLKIQMPAECLLWIYKDLVSLDRETKVGQVLGDNVNVRVEPKLKAEVVGQVDEGVCVVVTGEEGDWYEIRPPSTTYAWVHRDFVKKAEQEK